MAPPAPSSPRGAAAEAAGRHRDRMLLEAGLALSSELSLDVVLQRIVDLAVAVTGARYGALGVIGRDGTIADFITTGISSEERERIGHLPVGKGILGALIHEARPMRLSRIQDDPRSYGFPDNHPEMHSFLGAPVKAGGLVFGNIYLTEKQGAAEFSAEDEEALVLLAAQAGVAIENARLYEEAVLREQRLDALREIGANLLAGESTGDVLNLVARRAMQLAGADLATLATPSGDETMINEVVVGLHEEKLRGSAMEIEGSLSGDVMRSHRPVIVDDIMVDPRTSPALLEAGDLGPAMFFPLLVRGVPFGTLGVARRAGAHAFNADEFDFLQAYTTQAALALEYGRAQDELRRLNVLEDRERIAKDLHDGVIQSLFAVGMSLQAVALLSQNDEVQRRIESAVAEIDVAIRDLRQYIFGLRPGILSERGLEQALQNLAVELGEHAGVTTVVDLDGSMAGALAPIAGDIIQLVREALSNVGRHAEAATARVSLKRTPGGAALTIEDDGKGFDPAVTDTGLGLGNLRGRAETLGGRLEIESVPGDGTTVRVVLPL